jgi:hypothetical protein
MNFEKSDIAALVDKACIIDAKIKELDEQKKEISDILKAHAAETGMKVFHGTESRKAVIGVYSKSEVSALEFIETCEEMRVPQDVFVKALKVGMTQAKSILGEALLHSICKVETDLYGRITYKYKEEV